MIQKAKTILARLPLFQKTDSELRIFQILSLLALLYVILVPPTGLGFSTCFFYNMTALPCPGCGLSRSVMNVFRLHFIDALLYNPFGYFAAGAIAFFALGAFFAPLNRLYLKRKSFFFKALIALAIPMLLFGTVRLVWIVKDPTSARNYFHDFNEIGAAGKALQILQPKPGK